MGLGRCTVRGDELQMVLGCDAQHLRLRPPVLRRIYL
jgi:hypothetical protein